MAGRFATARRCSYGNLAPIGPFSDQDHLHQILVKHARVAHVPISEKRRHGMHSLRHTLATKLMEDGTEVPRVYWRLIVCIPARAEPVPQLCPL
jgi:hypothetical protein